jgi:hypothetical protein
MQNKQKEMRQATSDLRPMFQVCCVLKGVFYIYHVIKLPLRLSLACGYNEAIEIAPADIAPNFHGVFERLERLEAHVFPSREQERTSTRSSPTPTPAAELRELEAAQWHLSPALLRPSYLEVIVSSHAFRILGEKAMTMRHLGDEFFRTIYKFMPLVSREGFSKWVDKAQTLRPSGAFCLLILAIVLILEYPSDDDSDNPEGLPPALYQVCKYYYSLFLSFREPSPELIQAGLCLALYEHVQCISDRAYITIGTCARMMSLLRIDPNLGALSSQCNNMADASAADTNLALGLFIIDR